MLVENEIEDELVLLQNTEIHTHTHTHISVLKKFLENVYTQYEWILEALQ